MPAAPRSSAPRQALELVACLLAPLCVALAIGGALHGEPRWWTLTGLLRNAAAGMTLAANTAALLIMCAASAPSRRTCYRVAVFIVASLLIVGTMSGEAAPAVWLASHGVLAVAATAVLAARSLAARLWRHPLDAAGVTVLGVLALLLGALALGPALPSVPTWLVDALLRVNPAIAVTAAAGMDLLHTDLFYRVAPVAHWQFTYPGTAASVALFGGMAAALALISRFGRPGPSVSRHILRPEERL